MMAVRRIGLAVGAYFACYLVFAAFAAWQGANWQTLLGSMLSSSVLNVNAIGHTLLRTVPIGFAALAAAIPARAGLVNVGGEGQLVMGSAAATGVGLAVGGAMPGWLGIILAAGSGALAGALWAGIAAVAKVWFKAAEAVTTLLMNFIALDVMLFLIYQPWKDPDGWGQPQSRMLSDEVRLEQFGVLNAAVIALLVIAVLVWLAMDRTRWGFNLKVIGGNAEAANRFGLPSRTLLSTAMLAGGALAGLGGALNLMGVEGQLRPGSTVGFGYIAFLACFLGGNHPLKAVGAALLFSVIALSGNGLQLLENLDGAAVNVLLGLIVYTTLLVGRRNEVKL
jgi:simple sugar transport system permease protein